MFFGIDDNGTIKGIPDVKQACLDIENKVNDSITPQPDYTLELQNHDRTIKLTVRSGLQKPYLYQSKAYKRNDTATIEVDSLELSRLILQGKNIRFEELPCEDQELTFDTLCQKLKEDIQIETFNQDTLKTLNLYNSAVGYNNAAGILADNNHFPGIDLAKFGENISVIHKRATFDNRSILEVYEKALEIFKDYYQYEEIQGTDRKSENAIQIVLPILEKNLNLTEDERSIYKILSKTMLKPISEIAPYVAFGKSKTTQLLKEMEKKGVVKMEGRGRGTKYMLK